MGYSPGYSPGSYECICNDGFTQSGKGHVGQCLADLKTTTAIQTTTAATSLNTETSLTGTAILVLSTYSIWNTPMIVDFQG